MLVIISYDKSRALEMGSVLVVVPDEQFMWLENYSVEFPFCFSKVWL